MIMKEKITTFDKFHTLSLTLEEIFALSFNLELTLYNLLYNQKRFWRDYFLSVREIFGFTF
jgi:hypothetical protein